MGNWTQKYTKIYLFGSGGFIWSLFEPAPQSSLKLTCLLKFDEVKKVDMIFTWSKIRIYFLLLLPCQLKDQSFIKINLLVDYFFKKMNFISFERMLIVIIKVLSFICFLVIAFWISYTFHVSTLLARIVLLILSSARLRETNINQWENRTEIKWPI